MLVELLHDQIIRGAGVRELRELKAAIEYRLKFIASIVLTDEEMKAAKAGDMNSKISAIKMIRVRTNISLFDAKIIVDSAVNGSSSFGG